MTKYTHVIHAMFTTTHTVNLPKICDTDHVCKAACTLSSTNYIFGQASLASPCAHALSASLDCEVHLGRARGAINMLLHNQMWYNSIDQVAGQGLPRCHEMHTFKASCAGTGMHLKGSSQ